MSDPIQRGGSGISVGRDANRVPVTFGVSTTDGVTPVPLEVNPSTGQLQTSASGGGSGGTSSTFGATFPTSGTAVGAISSSGTMAGLNLNASGSLKVDGSGVTQPISASTLPLPTGASTSANQSTEISSLSTIATNTTGISTAANQTTMNTTLGTLATLANQTNGNQQSKITNGTTVADVIAGDTGFNGIITAQGAKTFSFTSSGTGAQTVGPFNVEGYSWIEIVYTSVGTGLALTGQFGPTSGGSFITFTTWANTNGGTNAANAALTASVATPSYGPVKGNWFQFALSALTGGTFSGTITLRATAPPIALQVNAAQNGTWTVGSNSATGTAVPANAFFMGASDGTNLQPLKVALGDASSSTNLLGVSAELYNGTNNDRTRNNTTGVVIAAGATSSNAGVTITTYNATKLLLAVNIASGAGTVTVAITGNTSSGYTYPILTSTALTGIGDNTLRVFPGATPSPNVTANDMLPRTFTVITTVVGTISYGIDYVLSV